MDIKTELESRGIKAKEERFLNPPPYPYIVFHDEQIYRGSDSNPKLIIDHVVTFKLYTKDLTVEEPFEKIESMLLELGAEFDRRRQWIDEQQHFLTTYDFEFTEKNRKLV